MPRSLLRKRLARFLPSYDASVEIEDGRKSSITELLGGAGAPSARSAIHQNRFLGVQLRLHFPDKILRADLNPGRSVEMPLVPFFLRSHIEELHTFFQLYFRLFDRYRLLTPLVGSH